MTLYRNDSFKSMEFLGFNELYYINRFKSTNEILIFYFSYHFTKFLPGEYDIRAKQADLKFLQVRFSVVDASSVIRLNVPYFYSYKRELFSFQNNAKKSRSILQDGSRSFGLFKKGELVL